MAQNYNEWPGYGPQGNNPNPGQGPRYPQRSQNNAGVDFVDSIKTCISKYVDFSGRASRSEFWWWMLFCFIVNCALALAPWVAYFVSVATLIPSLAVSWRRLHDIGKAGGYFFISLIPLVGWILVIVWYAQPSQPGPNRFGYGPDDIHVNRPPFI